MTELVHRHVDAEAVLDCPGDLDSDRLLIFSDAFPRDEQIAIHISIEARQDVATIPAKPPGHMVWNLDGEVLFASFRLRLRNMEEQTAPGAIRFDKMPLPIEAAQVLWPRGTTS